MNIAALVEQLTARYGMATVAAGAAIGLAVVLVLLIVVVRSRLRRRRERRWREPGLGQMRRRGLHDYVEETQKRPSAQARPGASGTRPRARLGFAGRFRWFLAGGLIGFVGTIIWASDAPYAEAVRSWFGRVVEPTHAIDPGEAPGEAPVAGPVATVNDALAAAIERRKIAALVDAYVLDMRGRLPVMVAPAIALARVEPREQAVALGFDMTQKLTPEEERTFRSELESRFRNGACAEAPGPLTISGLNQSGVAFDISYTDPNGRIFAEWRAPPGFCAAAR